MYVKIDEVYINAGAVRYMWYDAETLQMVCHFDYDHIMRFNVSWVEFCAYMNKIMPEKNSEE